MEFKTDLKANASIERTKGRPPHVLIVDDEPSVRHLVKSYLERFHYRTTEAADGQEALEVLSSEQVDIVISDYQMPGLNGLDLYRHIEKSSPSLSKRFILMTGTKFREAVTGFRKTNHVAFLEKPFRLVDLSTLLEEMAPPSREQDILT